MGFVSVVLQVMWAISHILPSDVLAHSPVDLNTALDEIAQVMVRVAKKTLIEKSYLILCVKLSASTELPSRLYFVDCINRDRTVICQTTYLKQQG